MKENDSGQDHRQPVGNEYIARMIYGQQCPAGYNCKAVDCIECLYIHMDGKGEQNGK